MVDEMALRKVFSEYFGFTWQFAFHRLLHIHHQLSSGAGTIGQTVAAVPNGLSSHEKRNTKRDSRDWRTTKCFSYGNRCLARDRSRSANCCIAQLRGQWHVVTFSVPITKRIKALFAAPPATEGASEWRHVLCPTLFNGPQGPAAGGWCFI
jgi:hypothetical protein